MRIGSIGLAALAPYKAFGDDKFGATLSEYGLAAAVLNRSPMLGWDVWGGDLLPALTATSEIRTNALSAAALRQRFGQRIGMVTPSQASHLGRESDYLLVTSLPIMHRMAELRGLLASGRTPICAVTHSLYTADSFHLRKSLVLAAEPHDAVVVSSSAGRETLENMLVPSRQRILRQANKDVVPPETLRIVQIPFGTDIPDGACLDHERARSLFLIPQHAFVVLYFGRITEEYKADLDPLIQSLHYLDLRGHRSWLILAGQTLDRTYVRHLERRLAALRLSERTICLENCPEFLKSSVYAACDVMVSPVDSIQETFGLSIIEAMAHARPVVASSWSGYHELVENGKTGFLIKTLWAPEACERASLLANIASPLSTAHYLAQRTILDAGDLLEKLTLLADNPELRFQMGAAGRKRAETYYAWPKVADQFLALWEDQLERAKRIPEQPRRGPILSAFSHYADAMLSPEDFLARIPNVENDDPAALDQWTFYSAEARNQVRQLMKLTADAPVSLGELRQEGFDLDCILWLAKKGLRRIIQLDSLKAALS